MDGKVFISYSNHDTGVADAVCSAIEGSGRSCWIAPRDIEPSSEWAEQIIDGINAADLMVLVFSSWSNKSPQVRREVERAIHRDIPVVPFRIEQVLPSKSLEYFLSTQHWFDAFDGRLDAHIVRLCALVRSLAERQAHDRSTTMDANASAGTPATQSQVHPTQAPSYRDDDLAFVARELARQIGPIARYLVQRASAANRTPSALIETLAAEFKEPKERAAFESVCRQRLGL